MKVNDLDELKQLLQEIEDACSKNGMDIYDMKIWGLIGGNYYA